MTSSSFCPSSVFRKSLGHSLSSGRPFCPFHPGPPATPASWGYGRAPLPAVPLREKGNGLFTPSPLQGKLPFPREVQEHHLPNLGGLGAAPPAFVGAPNSSLRAYRGLRPGDRDPIAVARSREVSRLADLGREEKELPFNSYDLFSLNNVKPMRLYKCAKWQNIIVIRVTAKRLKVLEQHDTLCSSRQHL
jgi:hypothetical protein